MGASRQRLNLLPNCMRAGNHSPALDFFVVLIPAWWGRRLWLRRWVCFAFIWIDETRWLLRRRSSNYLTSMFVNTASLGV